LDAGESEFATGWHVCAQPFTRSTLQGSAGGGRPAPFEVAFCFFSGSADSVPALVGNESRPEESGQMPGIGGDRGDRKDREGAPDWASKTMAAGECLFRHHHLSTRPTRFPSFVCQWKPGNEPKPLYSEDETQLEAGGFARLDIASPEAGWLWRL
jgi:hypothetical protein